jgi:predicted flap endonuclease-1-like 5' DNA nuclease
MNFENLNIWCWIIPALVGIICAILGYLLGKSGNTSIDNAADLKMCEEKNAHLKADLYACQQKLSAKPTAAPISNFTTPETPAAVAAVTPSAPVVPVVAFDATAAKAAFGKTIKQDDLKLVEGIGPKIESMFKERGIKTWKALSDASVADCQKVLDGGGNRYKIHDPASWPMQAKMCYEGKWTELTKWQDEHKHGKL